MVGFTRVLLQTHVVKTHLDGYVTLPKRIIGMRRKVARIEKLVAQLLLYPAADFTGYRQELTCVGNITLDEALLIGSRYLVSDGLPDGCRHTRNIDVSMYFSMITEQLEVLRQVVVGRDQDDASDAMVTAMSCMYNCLGYYSGRWIRHCPTVMGQAPPVSSVMVPQHRQRAPPVDLAELAVCVARLHTRPPVGRVSAAKKHWVAGYRTLAKSTTPAFPTREDLATWVLTTYPNDWRVVMKLN